MKQVFHSYETEPKIRVKLKRKMKNKVLQLRCGQDMAKTNKKRPKIGRLVELEGFEPSSKQATHKISTCLFCNWFSTVNRAQTPNLRLIFYNFRALAEASKTLFPHCYTPESDVAKQNF